MDRNRDTEAGHLLLELRLQRGLSPEEMPHAMRVAGIEIRNIPSSRTIRRVEAGVVPQVRHQFGLAAFYERPLVAIWEPRRARVTA